MFFFSVLLSIEPCRLQQLPKLALLHNIRCLIVSQLSIGLTEDDSNVAARSVGPTAEVTTLKAVNGVFDQGHWLVDLFDRVASICLYPSPVETAYMLRCIHVWAFSPDGEGCDVSGSAVSHLFIRWTPAAVIDGEQKHCLHAHDH